MKITVVLFDGFTCLDVVGGYEVLARLPGVELSFAAIEVGLIAADTRRLGLPAYKALSNISETDILYIPGGPGVDKALLQPELVEAISRLSATATWTVGICNGVELLGKANLLAGVKVTTNYNARAAVSAYGAKVVKDRYVIDGCIVTGAGVSASIDASLYLVGQIVNTQMAHLLQHGIEYYPEPPYEGALSVDKVDESIRQVIKAFGGSESERQMLAQTPPFRHTKF